MATKPIHRIVSDESAAMVAMQRRLIDAGLLATARMVNKASQKLGWEAARILNATKKASDK